MPYVRITSEEQSTIKKAVAESLVFCGDAQKTAVQASRLNRSKKPAMMGLATALKESRNELLKLKQALPKPQIGLQMPGLRKIGKASYEQELAAIKEKISRL